MKMRMRMNNPHQTFFSVIVMQVTQDATDKRFSWASYNNCDEIAGLMKSISLLRKQGIEFPKIVFVDWTKNTVRVQLE